MKCLDLSGERCPMTFVRARIAFDALAPGEEVSILLSSGEPLENMPRTALEQGYRLLSSVPEGNGLHRLLFRKEIR